MHICMYVCLCVYVSVCVSVCVCVCVCVERESYQEMEAAQAPTDGQADKYAVCNEMGKPQLCSK